MSDVFRSFSDCEVRLPLRLSDEDLGVILDADGRDVITVDTNGERPDDQVIAIADLIVRAINDGTGFEAAPKQVPGGGSPPDLDLRPSGQGR
jgi:hypothetical protein